MVPRARPGVERGDGQPVQRIVIGQVEDVVLLQHLEADIDGGEHPVDFDAFRGNHVFARAARAEDGGGDG